MICVNLLLDSREDRGEREYRNKENRMKEDKEKLNSKKKKKFKQILIGSQFFMLLNYNLM